MDAPVHAVLARIGTGQHGAGGQQLEGATKRETLVLAIAGPLVVSGIEHGYPQPAATLGFDTGEDGWQFC